MMVSQVAEVVAAAAKAVSADVDRSRKAMQQWKGDTVIAAESELDDLFARIDVRLARIVEDTTARVTTQFDEESVDVKRTHERFQQLRELHLPRGVRTRLD